MMLDGVVFSSCSSSEEENGLLIKDRTGGKGGGELFVEVELVLVVRVLWRSGEAETGACPPPRRELFFTALVWWVMFPSDIVLAVLKNGFG